MTFYLYVSDFYAEASAVCVYIVYECKKEKFGTCDAMRLMMCLLLADCAVKKPINGNLMVRDSVITVLRKAIS